MTNENDLARVGFSNSDNADMGLQSTEIGLVVIPSYDVVIQFCQENRVHTKLDQSTEIESGGYSIIFPVNKCDRVSYRIGWLYHQMTWL